MFLQLIHDCTCIDLLGVTYPIDLDLGEDKLIVRLTFYWGCWRRKSSTRTPYLIKITCHMRGMDFRKPLGDTHNCVYPSTHTLAFQKSFLWKERVQLDWVPCITSCIIRHSDSTFCYLTFSFRREESACLLWDFTFWANEVSFYVNICKKLYFDVILLTICSS